MTLPGTLPAKLGSFRGKALDHHCASCLGAGLMAGALCLVCTAGKKRLAALTLFVFGGLLLVPACSSLPLQFYDNGVTDAEYISAATKHTDAQLFLQKFPQAQTYVDRSGALAVDFRLDREPVTSTTQQWKGIRLRVFLDPETRQGTQTFVDCDGTMTEKGIRQVVERYASTQTCP